MTVITKKVPLYVENPEGSEVIQWRPDLQDLTYLHLLQLTMHDPPA